MAKLSPPSAIATSLQVDPPLIQDANYRFDEVDRAYIDDQIRSIQQFLVAGLIAGVVATYVRVSESSARVSVGDVLCSEGSSTGGTRVTRALAAPLTLAGAPLGIALTAASPGGYVAIALNGLLSAGITHLAAVSGQVIVNTTTARAMLVSALSEGDFPLGRADNGGWLTLTRKPSVIGGALPPSITSVAATMQFTLVAGQPLTITGTGFIAGATVKIGTTGSYSNCSSVVVQNSTTIVCRTGAIATEGLKDIVVTNPTGQTATLPASYRVISASLWLDASEADVTNPVNVWDATSKKCTQWTDRTGNALHAVQSTDSRRMAAGGVNGRAGMQGNRAVGTYYLITGGNLATVAAALNASGAEMFFVVRRTATPGGTESLWRIGSSPAGSGAPLFPFPSDDSIYEEAGTTARKNTGPYPGGEAAMTGVTKRYSIRSFSGNYTTLFENTQYFTTGTNTVGFNPTNWIIGGGSSTENQIPPTNQIDALLCEVVIVPRACTAQERTAIDAYLAAKWVGPWPNTILVTDGDSITANIAVTDPVNYPAGGPVTITWPNTMRDSLRKQIAPGSFSSGNTLINYATSGDNIQNMLAIRGNPGEVDSHVNDLPRSVLTIFAGTNDLALNSRTPLQVYNDCKAYIQGAKAAGWDCVIWITMLSRSSIFAGGVTESSFHAMWATFCAMADADHSFADRYVPIHLDPILGGTGWNHDPTLSYDGTHPTDLAITRIASLVTAEVSAFFNGT